MESYEILKYNIYSVWGQVFCKSLEKAKTSGRFFFQILWLPQKKVNFSMFELKIGRLRNCFYPTRKGNFRDKKPKNEFKKAVFIVL